MKISCVQMNMLLTSPDENFESACRLISSAAESGADVIVLPETWNTGFFPKENLESYCDRNGTQVKSQIGALAKKYGVNIVAGSVADFRDGKVYNTSYVFERRGECIAQYDKTHLFTPMGEDKYFRKGESLCRFELDGVPCGIIICYDLRFPELTRTLSLEGIDVLFVVAQWPAARINHLLALSKARAIENQMFLACCNSCGTAYDTVFGGNSCIYNPWGDVLAQAGETETIISAKCDLSVLKEIRETIDVFNDRRPALYHKN